MIQSIHKGRGFRGVLNYVFGRAKSPEIVGGNMYGTDPRDLAHEFAEWRELRPGLSRAVFHSSLSLPHGPGGREELGDAHWREVAERYLEHLGYGRSPFVVVRHRDTEHDHVHIIAARIGADGRAVSDSHDYRRGEEVLRQIEREYGLTQVRSAHEAERAALAPGEMRQLERKGEVSVRLRLQDLIDRAAADRPAMSTFITRLQEAGVEVAPRVATTGHVSGISYSLDGVGFRGSALGRSYSWAGLRENLGVDYQPDRDLASVRAAAGRSAGREIARAGTAWSPESVDALKRELAALPQTGGRSGVSRAVAKLARVGGEALSGPADAMSVAYALRSPRSAVRFAAARVPGLGAVRPLLDLAEATRSPLGLLLYGARLATAAGRLALPRVADKARSSAPARSVVAAYARAAATGRPDMPAFLERLRVAGVEPLPLLGRGGEVRAIVYRVGGELIPGQELGPSFTWSGLQRRLGVSYEPERDLPRIRAGRERSEPRPEQPRAERGGARHGGPVADPERPGRAGAAPRGDRAEAPGAQRTARGSEVAASDARVGTRHGADHPARYHGAAPGLGATPPAEGGAAPRRPAIPAPPAHGRAGSAGGAEVALERAAGRAGDERLAAAALRESLRRTGTPPLQSYHRLPAYAGNLERADIAWATAALRRGVEPHVVLREVAAKGARAAGSREAALAHGTRVVARALAAVQPGRAVEKTVALAAQALAATVKWPLALVKTLLIIRSFARELSQDRGR